MSDALALSSTFVEPVPFFSLDEPASRPRLRCLSPVSAVSDWSDSKPGHPLDCPKFEVDVVGDVLQLSLPAQVLPENRGVISRHVVRTELRDITVPGFAREPRLEVRLYRAVSRTRLLDVGVWSIGDYVHWEHEREHDFILLDAVDQVLRYQLPAGGGVPTLQRAGLFGTAVGAAFSFRP